MKKITYITKTLALAVLLFFMGCDTWESNLNINPNDALSQDENTGDDYDPNEFMLDMIGSTIRGVDYINWNVMSAVCEYHGKTISLSQGNRHQAWHAFDDSGWGGPWNGCYTSIRYLKKMKTASLATGDTRYQAISSIWECYNFFLLTLLYGDVPYSQTMQDNPPINPVYDKQEDIYFTLINKLRQAGKMIDPGTTIAGENDLIYGGDLTQWKKFANTMLIRYAMYMSDVAPDSTKAILNEILDDPNTYPIFESNSDNAEFHYDGVEFRSQCYNLSASKIDEAPFSNIFIERLVSLNDPRLPIYARPVLYTHSNPEINVLPSNKGSEKYAGHMYGLTTDNAYASAWNEGANYASKLGEYFRTEDDKGNATAKSAVIPLALATYSEMLSFLAEATQKGWISKRPAKDYYEASIKASFEYYQASFTSSDYTNAFGTDALSTVNDYLKQDHVAFDGGRDKLLLIAEQKWIASFLLNFEPYFDHRRTMLPPLRASSGAAAYVASGSATKFPSRADYPASELSTNPINVANANATAYDIPVTGQGDRNIALMWVLKPKGQDWLKMPVFQEPNYKAEYPKRKLNSEGKDPDPEFGTAFKGWYDQHWNTMFWWKMNDK